MEEGVTHRRSDRSWGRKGTMGQLQTHNIPKAFQYAFIPSSVLTREDPLVRERLWENTENLDLKVAREIKNSSSLVFSRTPD